VWQAHLIASYLDFGVDIAFTSLTSILPTIATKGVPFLCCSLQILSKFTVMRIQVSNKAFFYNNETFLDSTVLV